MQHEVRVSTRHAVTIPSALRDHLGIEPGDVLTFVVEEDGRLSVALDGDDVPAVDSVPATGETPSDVDDHGGEVTRVDVFGDDDVEFDPQVHLRDPSHIADRIWTNAS